MRDIELAAIEGGTLIRRVGRARETVEVAPFEIGVFAVTEEELAELLGIPSRHPRRPAVEVSWQRAVRWCNAASEWEGLDPAYRIDGDEVRWDGTADGYRLPTETEWEYACRAGSPAAQYGPLAEVAYTAADGLRAPADVGGRHPNLHGLFDTLGNVWEWCWDPFDPEDPSAGRVFRGGGFTDGALNVRADVRRGARASAVFDDVGFRAARGPGPAPEGRGRRR